MNRLLSHVLVALLAGCVESRTALVSPWPPMTHAKAHQWCRDRGSELAPVHEIDTVLELCFDTGYPACWIDFESNAGGERYVASLDGALTSVDLEYRAPAVCVGAVR